MFYILIKCQFQVSRKLARLNKLEVIFWDLINLTPRYSVSRRGILLPGALRCFRPYSAMHPGIFTQAGPVGNPRSSPSFPVPLSLSLSLSLTSSRNVIVFAAGPVLGVTDLPERVASGSSEARYEKMKQTRGNSMRIFASVSLFFIFARVSMSRRT